MAKPKAATNEGFIANIDEANEEITRLRAQVAKAEGLQAELDELRPRIEAVEASLQKQTEKKPAEATPPAKPAVAAEATTTVEAEVVEETPEAKIKRLEGELAAAKTATTEANRNGVKAVAAAGIEQPAQVRQDASGIEADKTAVTHGLTGLSRAIAANIEQHNAVKS